ncbi:NUDIX domain-containing protein [Roseomonas sp. NAR14]|uniref:NUDIX domain-containing protein n=1 Tax=Roseomonas acroporae TaxID=2937791 RepID=A0A9X2BUJ1_9PROT|nr:NUDIX domain-containing protein [Roseomonas acroporae]MCK8785698.1 NUDIX domain-containing protein [Roseomonas acroporae]
MSEPSWDNAAAAPVAARLAATVLLLREGGRGPEVFMVVRHRAIEFASGALVFPGGRVENGDRAVAEAAGLADLDSATLRIAAIRETFEECGILLARPEGSGRLVDAARLRAVEAAHRAALCRNERGLDSMLAAERLAPAEDALVHFAHWITPADRSKRFDTHFFAAEAPPDQLGAHDGGEAVDSVWIRPADVIAQTAEGRWKLLFPTRLNLLKLARHDTVAAILAAARAEPVVTVQPRVVKTPEGPRLCIPEAAGYGGSLFPMLDPPAI